MASRHQAIASRSVNSSPNPIVLVSVQAATSCSRWYLYTALAAACVRASFLGSVLPCEERRRRRVCPFRWLLVLALRDPRSRTGGVNGQVSKTCPNGANNVGLLEMLCQCLLCHCVWFCVCRWSFLFLFFGRCLICFWEQETCGRTGGQHKQKKSSKKEKSQHTSETAGACVHAR